jgi:eukaryotic-like serine/threonine-protein kinase
VERTPGESTRLIWRRSDPLIGAVLDGRFRIVAPLGTGGMGSVYRGVQLSVDRPVAIKVIAEQLSDDRAAAKRFLREAKVLTGFSHPNIVNVFDFGQAETGELYIVMELLRGETLADVLARGKLPARLACDIAIQLCDALIAAHGRGVVHRDLKPGNVMIGDGPLAGLVKVLDFGLAKTLESNNVTTSSVTEIGAVLGTPLYMAPEAIGGAGADPRSDLYALGCMLYEMLSGTTPFDDPSVNVVLVRQLGEPPPMLPDDVPIALCELVDELLAKDPDARPPSAIAVRARLDAYLGGSDLDDAETLVTAPPTHELPTVRDAPAPPSPMVTVPPRNGLPPIAIAVIVASALIIAIAWMLAIGYRS